MRTRLIPFVALDSGRFASAFLDVRKAITITAAPGAHAEISTSDFGVYVNAGASDVVVLRGLVFRGSPSTANTAIVLNSARALHVENCVISDFPTSGTLTPLGGS
jgi:nitrous oxidase accessory protein NosD